VARKGSITVDGTSLTVNEVAGHRFFVNIVPHTLERTIMGHYEEGTRVNIEVDLVARYIERLMMKS
jgi:riboflavin synthase